MQALTVQQQGPHHGNFFAHQFSRKTVLFLNLRVGPTVRPIELGHQGGVVIKHDLVDAVFIRTQRRQTTIDRQAHRFQRIQHHQRRERIKVMLGMRLVAHTPHTMSLPAA